jgi:hypothetical protein
MKNLILWSLLLVPFVLSAQESESGDKELPLKWEELTSPEFVTAVKRTSW